MLIILGIECVAVARFAFSPESSLPQFIKQPWFTSYSPEQPAPSDYALNAPNGGFGQSGGYGHASQYGPSRFNNNPFQVASGSIPTQGASPFNLPSANNGQRTPQLSSSYFKTEEWMPWSLIAAGTIVTLYTHSLYRNQSGS